MKLLLVVACLPVLVACDRTAVPEYPRRTPPPDLAAAAQAGAPLFARLCASCHGTTGEGRSPRADFFVPPAPDFREASYRSADPAYLYWRIETGKSVEPYRSRGSVMPAWGESLSAEQLWSLVAYVQQRSR